MAFLCYVYIQLMLIGPEDGANMSSYISSHPQRRQTTIHHSTSREGRWKNPVAPAGVSVGMNNFAATCLESSRRLAPTQNHEEEATHLRLVSRRIQGRIRIRVRIEYWLANVETSN